MGAGTLSMGVSTPPKWSRNILCVSGTSKTILVHGSLIEAEILTSPPPCISSTWASCWAPALCPWVCQHLPSGLEMFLCVSETSQKNLVYGALIEAEILTSPLPMYLTNSAQFWALALCPQVCQHLPSSLNVPMCLRNLPKEFGTWGPQRSWDIGLPTCQCISSTQPSFGCWHSVYGCVNTSKMV